MNPTDTTLLATWRDPGEVAIRAGWKARESGADLLTTVEKALVAAELDPDLIAIGLGSLPNEDGVIELDASIMDGKTLEAGSVCAVQDIVPAISLAKAVMEKTPHIMLAGQQARRFAIENGFHPQVLNREKSQAEYRKWRDTEGRKTFTWKDYIHASHQLETPFEHTGDTVTVLGLEKNTDEAHCAVASSTSGLSWKKPGRVGDSPIIGAGIYADDEVGCAGATGWGEELWKAVASFRTIETMRRGASAQEACEETILQMIRRQPKSTQISCVVFAMGINGEFGAAITTGQFTLWICRNGEFESRDYQGLYTS